MPVQIVPPMYKMLQEEVQWAIEDASIILFIYFTKQNIWFF
jgi:hypothetical protein